MVESPAVACLALWLGQWLRGVSSPDELFSAIAELAPDTSPQILTAGAPRPLTHLLASAAAVRADAAWVVLPRPGGPGPVFPMDGGGRPMILITARRRPCLVITLDRGAWSLTQVDRGPRDDEAWADGVDAVLRLESAALTPRAARRRLLELLADGTQRLTALGLDRPTALAPARRWAAAMVVTPGGIDPDAVALLRRAAVVLDALDLALAQDGAAVTAREASLRHRELRRLSQDVGDLVVAVVNGQAAMVPVSGSDRVTDPASAPTRRL